MIFRKNHCFIHGSELPRPRTKAWRVQDETKTKTLCLKTKTLKLSLETSRDQDLSLENYITGYTYTAGYTCAANYTCTAHYTCTVSYSCRCGSTTSLFLTQEMQLMKMSKPSGLTKLQQRANRSSMTSCAHPLPSPSSSSSSSSSTSSSPAAVDHGSVADSLSIVESRVCRELMVDKFNRVSTPPQFN